MLRRLSFQAIAKLAETLPRPLQYSIARRIGDVYYAVDRGAREATQANMRIILGPEATEAMVRREARWVFRHFAMYLCEFFGYRSFGHSFIDQNVTVYGRENLDAALKRGRGAIFCSSHYSNWELGATVVAHLKYPITIVAQMHADPQVNDLFIHQRVRDGINVVPTQHGAKGALKALRQNHGVAFLGDRPTGGPCVPVTLFGRTIQLPQGPWRIALTSGAALLPTFVQRRFNNTFTLEIGAPIDIERTGTLKEQAAAMAQKWAQIFEERLRAEPSQWAAFYKAWDVKAPAIETVGGAEKAASESELTAAKHENN